MIEYLTITREFEIKKRTVSKTFDTRFITRLSTVLNQKYSMAEKVSRIESFCSKNQVTVVRDKIKISTDLMKIFFTDSLGKIVKHVEEILKKHSERRHNIILLVGGYSESPMLQETFKTEFKGKRIIIPQDYSLAVMKGVVIFGFIPSLLQQEFCVFHTVQQFIQNLTGINTDLKRRYLTKEGT